MTCASDLECARRLRRAVENRELTLAYQPKLHIPTGTVSGVEALARWHDDELGPVPPTRFIPVAEHFGLLDGITDFVLRTAIDQWVCWHEQGIAVHMAVNVSALNLRDETLPDIVERMCMRAGMPCDYLTVEITESATLNIVRLLETLTRFRLKGFRVSLDDFGTGYSSLARLRQLPYSEIKIDRCFVHDLAFSHEAPMIVSAIVGLAHAMGLTAVAEGVEDAKTLALLEALGCDEAQGFHLSRPLMGPAFVEWLLNSGRGWGRCKPVRTEASFADPAAAARLPRWRDGESGMQPHPHLLVASVLDRPARSASR